MRTGLDLPAQWALRDRFVVLETSFGLGRNFLAAWDSWRGHARRCNRLVYIAIEAHPPTQTELARAYVATPLAGLAAMLADAWPALTPNLHVLSFEKGAVQLLLGFGALPELLPQIHAQIDAFYLGGEGVGQDAHDLRIVKALALRAAPQARLVCADASPRLRNDLRSAGFVVAPDACGIDVGAQTRAQGSALIHATYAPHFALPRQHSIHRQASPTTRTAVIVGAGIAGACAAHALAQLGWAVTVLDRHAAPAEGASGNPAAIFHGTVHADDGVHARIFRAAALHAQRLLHPLIARGGVPGQSRGLLRLETQRPDALKGMQHLLRRQGLPAQYVQALDANEASRMSGVALQHPAWFYPGGGWVDAPALVRHLLDAPGISFRGGHEVFAIQREADAWQVRDAAQRLLAEGSVLVLAQADAHSSLITPLGHAPWPLERVRGQVSFWRGDGLKATPLALPVAGDGYALPLADGGVLCGAASERNDAELEVMWVDHQHNFERLQRVTGLLAPSDSTRWQGRVGWRVHASDRLPIVGPVPLPESDIAPGTRLDQVRLVPRSVGLFVCSAFGARGVTLAPLAGALLAAQISGTPLPLEQDLVDAVDPARWLVRAARRRHADAALDGAAAADRRH